MRRTWLLAAWVAAGCGDSGGASDGGTETDTDTDTETTFATETTTGFPTTTSPTTTANPTVPGTVTTTLDTTDTDSTTTGPIAEGIYVHAALGADSNPGTPDEPVRTIQLGIELAASQGLPFVHVAAGDYIADSDANDVVEMVEGVSIQGGYAADDWAVRNPQVFVSRIVDVAVTPAGFTPANPHRAVYVGPGIGPETRIDGFTIEASAQPNSAAVVVQESAPTIVGSSLFGGGGSYSTAVYAAAGSPRLFRDLIDGVGSTAPQPSFAVRGIDCAPQIQGSTMRSGEGTNNRTVFLDGCAGTIASSVVLAERGLGGGARAIELADSTTQIVSNTLVVDSETVGYFVIALGASTPGTLTANNFVPGPSTGTSWCYLHLDTLDVPSVYNNNFGCSNVYSGSVVYNTIAQLEMGHADASDNVAVESGVVDPSSDWRLRSDGTTLCAVSRGGIDIGVAATTDADGVARTEPWSIGAYELDSGCL